MFKPSLIYKNAKNIGISTENKKAQSKLESETEFIRNNFLISFPHFVLLSHTIG